VGRGDAAAVGAAAGVAVTSGARDAVGGACGAAASGFEAGVAAGATESAGAIVAGATLVGAAEVPDCEGLAVDACGRVSVLRASALTSRPSVKRTSAIPAKVTSACPMRG
jgi:hypothetical protein